MIDSPKKWKYLSIGLMGFSAILILALISNLILASAEKLSTASISIVTIPEGDDFLPALFTPSELQIKKKTTVTWTDQIDGIPHTVTEVSDTPLFDSSVLSDGGTFSYTFNKKGEFSYYCRVHPDMTGEIVVG